MKKYKVTLTADVRQQLRDLAVYEPLDPVPWLHAEPFERTVTSDDLLAYLRSLPPASVPRVVVLDNASLHISKVTKAARPGLAKAGIHLHYLPPYSPELNRIEAMFKQVKHHEMPTRSHTSKAELRMSVERGFDSYCRTLPAKGEGQPRLAHMLPWQCVEVVPGGRSNRTRLGGARPR